MHWPAPRGGRAGLRGSSPSPLPACPARAGLDAGPGTLCASGAERLPAGVGTPLPLGPCTRGGLASHARRPGMLASRRAGTPCLEGAGTLARAGGCYARAAWAGTLCPGRVPVCSRRAAYAKPRGAAHSPAGAGAPPPRGSARLLAGPYAAAVGAARLLARGAATPCPGAARRHACQGGSLMRFRAAPASRGPSCLAAPQSAISCP
ncbi:hypothetical protein OIU79_000601 [Salix purpurea]|uniref:Uncharacterized protein n=1 Tax=Salix purpurea TaxID=77065 RepID=A0A9Q0V2I2_SALPP|nr:hypothetical protein OIU79_000601 [Salix purpurea]